MKTFQRIRHSLPSRQRGVAAVEFALVAGLFFTLLLGIMEMGRILFYWNSAAEATRLGARIAVVCDLNDADIKIRMRRILSILPNNKISIAYQPSGCDVNSCQSVQVSILPGVSVATYIPYAPLSLSLPSFTTTLPRESMRSTMDGIGNPVCS